MTSLAQHLNTARPLAKRLKPRGHRFQFEVDGLTNEQAARLYYELLKVAKDSPGQFAGSSTNTPRPVCEALYPTYPWVAGPAPCKIGHSQKKN